MEQKKISASASRTAAAGGLPRARAATISSVSAEKTALTPQQCHNKFPDDKNVKSATSANTITKHNTECSSALTNAISSENVHAPLPSSTLPSSATTQQLVCSATQPSCDFPATKQQQHHSPSPEYGGSDFSLTGSVAAGIGVGNNGNSGNINAGGNKTATNSTNPWFTSNAEAVATVSKTGLTSTSYPGRSVAPAVSPTLKSPAPQILSLCQSPLPDKKSENSSSPPNLSAPYDQLLIPNTPDKDLDCNVYANVYAASFERKKKEKDRPGEKRDQNLICPTSPTATQCQLSTAATSIVAATSNTGGTASVETSTTAPRHNSLPISYPPCTSTLLGAPSLPFKNEPSSCSFHQSPGLRPPPAVSTPKKQRPSNLQSTTPQSTTSPLLNPTETGQFQAPGVLEGDQSTNADTPDVLAETSPKSSPSFLGIKQSFKPNRKPSPKIKRFLPPANRAKQNKVALLEKSRSVDAAASTSLYSQTGSSYDTCYSSFNGNEDLGEDISERTGNITEVESDCPNSPNKPKTSFFIPSSASDHFQLNKLNNFTLQRECELEDNDRYLNEHSNPSESLLTTHNSAGNLRQIRTHKSLACRNNINNDSRRPGSIDPNTKTLCYPNGSVNRGSPRSPQQGVQDRGGVNSRHSSLSSVNHPQGHSPSGKNVNKRSSIISSSGNMDVKLDCSMNKNGGSGGNTINRSASIGAGHLHSKESKQTQAHASYRLGFRRSLFEKRKKLSDYAMLFSLIGISLMVLEHELSYQIRVSQSNFLCFWLPFSNFISFIPIIVQTSYSLIS